MRIARNDQVLAAALALLLTTAGTAVAAPDSSGRSVTGTAAAAQPSEADLNSRIPLPEPLDVPPPSAKDVARRACGATARTLAVRHRAVTSAPEPTITSATQPAATAAPAPPRRRTAALP